MATYKKGSSGDDVSSIQNLLKGKGMYDGAGNGVFDDRTETAVKAFQTGAGLIADGVVGPATWARLFPPAAIPGDLASRCLALTGSFETGHLAPDCFAAAAGNFDGQGMSFGALQWNFGQGTLQPLLMKMFETHHDISLRIFGDELDQLIQAIKGDRETAVAFAVSMQVEGKKRLATRWSQMFRQLGFTPEFQAIETKAASAYHQKGVRLCGDYGLWTERGLALMFDIAVQNGGIPDKVRNLISGDVAGLKTGLSPESLEVEKMKIVANRRAEAVNPAFMEDVRKRKLCIAEGIGVVHGISYDLAGQFGLRMKKADLQQA